VRPSAASRWRVVEGTLPGLPSPPRGPFTVRVAGGKRLMVAQLTFGIYILDSLQSERGMKQCERKESTVELKRVNTPRVPFRDETAGFLGAGNFTFHAGSQVYKSLTFAFLPAQVESRPTRRLRESQAFVVWVDGPVRQGRVRRSSEVVSTCAGRSAKGEHYEGERKDVNGVSVA